MKEINLDKLHKIYKNLKTASNNIDKEWGAFEFEERWIGELIGNVWGEIDESIEILEEILDIKKDEEK